MDPDLKMMDEAGALSPREGTRPTEAEICVPIEALSMPDEQEQMTAPEPGDAVNGQFEGKVSRVSGDMAYVQVESVNGKELGADKGKEPALGAESESDSGDAAYDELQNLAKEKGPL